MNQPPNTAQDLTTLTNNWIATKANLAAAQAAHLQSEIDLYNAVKDTLPVKGTTTLETGIKIVTGFSEKWEQPVLNDIYNAWEAPVPFPFKGEWKPESKQLSYIRDNLPALWKRLQEAVTIQDKKPAFSMKGDA